MKNNFKLYILRMRKSSFINTYAALASSNGWIMDGTITFEANTASPLFKIESLPWQSRKLIQQKSTIFIASRLRQKKNNLVVAVAFVV
jgi:hypothetical protein